LLRCQGEDPKQFHHNLDQYLTHSGGNLSEDFETVKVVLKTLEEVVKRVVALADILDSLKNNLGVRAADAKNGRKQDTH
jgi:hypothetical protein